MALVTQSLHSCVNKSPYLLHPTLTSKTRLTVVRATTEEPKPANEGSPNSLTTPPTKSNSSPTTGVGFGSSSSVDVKKKQQRSRIVRRNPIEKSPFVSQKVKAQQPQEQSRNETAFLLTWLGLGSLILIEGLTLAASGFLPEEWDKFLVKYLYPIFTPTVFFFVAGTVVYGVLKYLQVEKKES